jgi:hypothetical protein
MVVLMGMVPPVREGKGPQALTLNVSYFRPNAREWNSMTSVK